MRRYPLRFGLRALVIDDDAELVHLVSQWGETTTMTVRQAREVAGLVRTVGTRRAVKAGKTGRVRVVKPRQLPGPLLHGKEAKAFIKAMLAGPGDKEE